MSRATGRDEGDAAFEQYLERPRPQSLAPVISLLHEEAWRIALRVTGNEEDAADVTQDFFLGLLLSPPAAGSIRSPRGYMAYRILTLAARRTRSAARREKREAAAARRLTSSETTAADIEALSLEIDSLPERVRAAVELHYLAGYTCREIALLTGVSERTVASDLQKGRESLRLRLGAGALGILTSLSTRTDAQGPPPAALLDNLMTIAASGSVLGPLVASPIAGVLAMKKLITICVGVAILGGGWVTVRLQSDRGPEDGPAVVAGGPPAAGTVDLDAPDAAPSVAAVQDRGSSGPLAFLAVEDEEGLPIAEAKASLVNERGAKTELKCENGRFEVSPPAVGPSTKLLVAAEGFFPEETALSTLAAGETRQVTLMAVRELEVRAVVEASAAPLAGCEVHVHRNLYSARMLDEESSEVLESGAGGRAVVRDLRSTDKLHIFAVHETARLLSDVVEVKTPFESLTLPLKPMGYVRGRVIDVSRQPIAGADVWFHAATTEGWKLDARILRGFDHTQYRRSPHELDTTDGEGRFLVRWPARWRAVIAARAEGHVASLQEVPPEEIGGEIEVVLERSALIEAVVLDEKGQPAAAGATFAVASDDPESADPVRPWRVYYHSELNAPYRAIIKDIEHASARHLIVEHKGKYRRQVIPLDDEERTGKRQVIVRLAPEPAKGVLIELAVKPLDRVTGSSPLRPHPHVSVFRAGSEEALHVEGNDSIGDFAWWCAVEPGDYRVEVATPGFLTARETISVREGSGLPSQSGCCAEQFLLEVPIERDPNQQGRFDLGEVLHLELLDARDRKPPPEGLELTWEAFRLPERTPSISDPHAPRSLRHQDGAARIGKVLKAGEYEVRLACEGFREAVFTLTLPQESPIIEVPLHPEWENPAEARAAIPELIRKLRHDRDGRARAGRGLVRIGLDAAPALLELLSDSDLDARRAAIYALGQMETPHPEAIERIVLLLRDPERWIRMSALQALGSLGRKAAVPISAMIGLLEDADSAVRSSAAAALGTLGPAAREAAAPLELLLDDEDKELQRQAEWALKQITRGGESRP